MISEIDRIWEYSNYYGDMVATAKRLHDAEENYAAIMILFNAMELIFKSVRENFDQNINQDLVDLKNKNLITEDEFSFLNDKENGIRVVRNIMTHRNAYQYCLEDVDGIALPFADSGTWSIVYNSYAPRIMDILVRVIYKSNHQMD